jgi:hypothetical protein
MMYELFLGWRYLYRRGYGPAAPIAAGLSFLGTVAGLVALFGYGEVRIGAILLVPSTIVFIFSRSSAWRSASPRSRSCCRS